MRSADTQSQHNHNPARCRIPLQLFILILIFTVATEGHALDSAETIIQNNCRTCHGVDGQATVESWPNLACQNRGYLYSRLIKLQSSSDHNIDEKIKELSMTEVDENSRYYSELKCPNRH